MLTGAVDPPAPPPLLSEPAPKPSPVRQLLAIVLSLCLGLFLADAALSLADDSLILLAGSHVLTVLRELAGLFALAMAILVYLLMGLTPMIPKRLFLPIALFNPIGMLVAIPCLIYCHGWMPQVGWVISCFQLSLGLGILCRLQGGLKVSWRLVPEGRLEGRGFGWLNLVAFLLLNVLVLLPAAAIYLAVCAGLAVDHFSGGFLALRPSGLTVQVRTYIRNDGKTIQLCPMAHIGEASFYRKVSRSFPTNSVVLMEGVTDKRNLLTNSITYKRAATSLGLAEQKEEFNPSRGELVMADVDVEQFSAVTIDFLNLVMLIHAKGVNSGTMARLMQYSPPAHLQAQIFEDLLHKRNRRLLEELRSRLAQSENIIVPWGVAHMPEIAAAIQESGFRLDESREYQVVRFRSLFFPQGKRKPTPRPSRGRDEGVVQPVGPDRAQPPAP